MRGRRGMQKTVLVALALVVTGGAGEIGSDQDFFTDGVHFSARGNLRRSELLLPYVVTVSGR